MQLFSFKWRRRYYMRKKLFQNVLGSHLNWLVQEIAKLIGLDKFGRDSLVEVFLKLIVVLGVPNIPSRWQGLK
jgi:hypothetical protein